MTWAGETLLLLPERAVWWPREKTLFIADPHFGKASAFRFAGLPVPETPESEDLARLELILCQTGAQRLVILGDFFHSRTGRSESMLSALGSWRACRQSLPIVLVEGNHDRHAGAPPAEWRFDCVKGPWQFAPFYCCHEPEENPGGFVLAGHLHPAFHLSERTGAGLRNPCFHFGRRLAVLPAFGSFTGNCSIKAARGDQVFLVGPRSVIDVSRLIRK
ncbi:MAG: ICC-like phosphoesterase-like protein [Chthoniobacteraceae bacterium]|nr:ICC-like phosphoesterase-like protein [Chthoniobacteraceae bacterium]